MWYVPKQLFSLVSVKVVELFATIHLHLGELVLIIKKWTMDIRFPALSFARRTKVISSYNHPINFRVISLASLRHMVQ